MGETMTIYDSLGAGQFYMLVGAVSVCAAVCVMASKIGAHLDVMAVPDGQRRKHTRATPQLGGVAILIPFILWCCLTTIAAGVETNKILTATMLSAAGVGLVGFADDQRETSPLSRMLSLVVFLTISFSLDPQLISGALHWGSFQSVSIPFHWYWPLMAVTFVGLVNAVNMADGQNGIVGSIYTVWLICLLLSTTGIARDIAMVLLACSIVFLAFNLRGYIFLGDAGTYGVTFVIGLLVTLAHAQGQLTLEAIIVWFYIPVLDCLRLLITRPMQRRSPLDGDRDHFHHRLQDKFGKDIGLAIYAGLVATTSLASTLAPRFSLVCLVVLTAVYFSFARLTGATTAQSAEAADEDKEVHKPAVNIIVMNESLEKKSKGTSSLS